MTKKFEVGDRVLVAMVCPDWEYWDSEDDEKVGLAGHVDEIDEDGLWIDFEEEDFLCLLPPEALEHAPAEAAAPLDIEATFAPYFAPFFMEISGDTAPTPATIGAAPPGNLVHEYNSGFCDFTRTYEIGQWVEIIMSANPGDGGWVSKDALPFGEDKVGKRAKIYDYSVSSVLINDAGHIYPVPYYCLKPVDGPHPPKEEYTNSFPAMREFLHETQEKK